MWTLYLLSKSTNSRPSELLELLEYYLEKFNHDGYIARLQFDKAVNYFGNRVENLLAERDKNHKRLYELEDILSDNKEENPQDVKSAMSRFSGIQNAFRVRKGKKNGKSL